MAASREAVRDHLTSLIAAAMVGAGLPAQQVFGYRIGDFESASPVVVVSSKGSDRRQMTMRGGRSRFILQVDWFVLYALEDGTWTEAQAEDTLDAIETLLAEVVRANQVTQYWGALDYQVESQRTDVAIGGIEYAREWVQLVAEVFA